MQVEELKAQVDTQGKVMIMSIMCYTLVLTKIMIITGGFIVIKHRIPEIVVPNLDGFEVGALQKFCFSLNPFLPLSLSLALSLSLSLSLSLLPLPPP